jgi:hypothetical protein
MNALAPVALAGALLAAATPDVRILVRSDNRPVEVDGERYRLVSATAPLVGVVQKQGRGRARLVVYVVRLGYADEPVEGATPVVVTIGNERHIFPNRPRLVRERALNGAAGRIEVASYPVRYPLGRVRGRSTPVRVSLRRAERGGRVGVRLALETEDGRALVPIRNRLVRPRRQKRKRLPARPKVAPPVDAGYDAGAPVLARLEDDELDAGVADASADASVDAGHDAGHDAGWDAGPPPAPKLPTGRVTIALDNRMPDVFLLQAVDLTIDGYPIEIPPVGVKAGRTRLFDGDLTTGEHHIDISLTYRGKGGLFFSYLDDYTFHAGDGARIKVEKGRHTDIRIEGYEGGNFITEMVDRPAVRFHFGRANK